MLTKKEIRQLMIEDLERSDLDIKDIKKMKLESFNKEEASIILNSTFATDGYVVPYFDTSGKVVNSIRFRFLTELLNDRDKVVKYSQPKGTEPRLYFPPCIKWKSILKDVTKIIVFTEGEKKAYAACKAGIPTIGLGGVWSFKCKRLRKRLIDDFNEITLRDRIVYTCFDNDSHTNEEVMKALRAFAKELNNEGADVYNKPLPFDPYQKIGLDDYLITNSAEDFDNLPTDSFDELDELAMMNDKVAYIKDIGKFFIFDSNLFVGSTALKNDVFANLTMPADDGGIVNVASMWLSWINRRTHKCLTYKPGSPSVTNNNEYNMWKGWGCEPKKGSVKVFLDAVNRIFGNDQELVKWFLDWVAYPIQNPATKMLSGVLLQSIAQGTGKSSIGLCIGSMYGDNYQLINDQQLHQSFNEWAIGKQFVLGDEISGKDKRQESDRIKNLITQPEITINKKYAPTYTIPDCINYLFTSNHPDALNIEPDDRRMFVHAIKDDNKLSLSQGKALERFRDGVGTRHLLYYFAYEHEVSKGFDHRARPPMTLAKEDLIDHSLTDIERFLVHLKANPEHVLTIDGVDIDRDLFTTSHVIHLYNRINPNVNVSVTAMGKALNKIFNDCDIVTVRTANGVQRLRVLRNFNKWKKADHNTLQAHYDRSKIALFNAAAKKDKHKE